jgi:hypothetical protein
VKIASWIQVDEMRTLLEIHYDQAFFDCLSSFFASLLHPPTLFGLTYATDLMQQEKSGAPAALPRTGQVRPEAPDQ